MAFFQKISKYQRIINALFFLLPLVYLGSGIGFQIYKLLIAVIFAIILIVNKIKVREYNFLYLIFLTIYMCFVIREGRYGALTSILILYMSYLWFYCEKIPFETKKIAVDNIFRGFLLAGVAGFIYMCLTNQIVYGGKYTENNLNISNLTVPLYLSLYIIYGSIRTLQIRKKLMLHMLFYLLLFIIIVFLEKRGPIVFCIFSIVFVLKSWTAKLKKALLIILFLYPFYGLPLTEFVVKYYKQTFGLFFDRSTDFESVDGNPRIIRLYAAEQFVSDFQFIDLLGYHKQLLLTQKEDDVVHNHFHNIFLQLYYERGLISIIIFLFFLFKYDLPKNKNTLILRINYAAILFLILIGTNESILKSGSNGELFLMLMLLFGKLLNDHEKTV